MTDTLRFFAGDCTTTFEGTRDRTQRGHVVVVVKPDKTVLVHDADGYQPVAWLTRADSVTIETDDDGFGITAQAGDQTLRVVSHVTVTRRDVPITAAGVPVGTCPDCDGALVRAGGDVRCLGCDARYGLPSGATVLDRTCADCGLPLLRVERGDVFEVCTDYRCDSLPDHVTERFDEEWTCPDCAAPLRIVRGTGGHLVAGCDAYPECETAFSLPAGVVVDDCDCGLPVFETAAGRRCLDGTCERYRPALG